MAASSENLAKKIDTLVDLFAEVGKQLKDLQIAVQKNVIDLREMEKGQKEQSDRIRRLEIGRENERLRMSYMEDQLRRNNLRLRGFKKDFAEGGDMILKICQWLKENNIDIVSDDIERAHWTIGLRREGAQKDIIIKFVFGKKAEEIFKALKKIPDLNYKEAPIRALKDFSFGTLQERKKMRPIAELLFRNGISFSWQYPATIVIFRDGRSLRAKSLEEGKKLLSQFGIDMEPPLQIERTGAGDEALGAAGGEKQTIAIADFFAPLETSGDQGDTLRMRALEEELAKLRGKRGEKGEEPEQRVTRQQQKKK